MSDTSNVNYPQADAVNPLSQDNAASRSPAVDKLTEKTRAAIDVAAETAGEKEQLLRQRAIEAEVQIRELGDKVQKSAQESSAQVEAYIVKNPLTSAGIAFAVGVVAAALLRR